MDTTQFTTLIMKYIQPVYLTVFMAMAYAFKNPLTKVFTTVLRGAMSAMTDWDRERIMELETDKNITVFFIGMVCALPFYFLGESDWMKMLVTFALGTSLHDLIISQLLKLLPKKNDPPKLKDEE